MNLSTYTSLIFNLDELSIDILPISKLGGSLRKEVGE